MAVLKTGLYLTEKQLCLAIYLCAIYTAIIQSLHHRPNLILFVADDLGYGDLSIYGHPSQEAGPIDKMAMEGMKMTQMYAAASFCTPSRAALLTGRQPFRTGMVGSTSAHIPSLSRGLHHDEVTLPENLKELGYSTGMIGKWHLGINNNTAADGAYLPHTHGFDYVGTFLPFTLVTRCDTEQQYLPRPRRESCFLYRNRSIVQQPINLRQLTSTLVTDAKTFLHEHSDKPFFLYFAFPQVHTPMFNMPRFNGSSKRGAFGDSINEMSWAVGEILDTLTLLRIDRTTLSVFISDHGPHLEMCQWGGVAGPLSGGKAGFHEGSLRVPAIFHWPGVISPGSVSNTVTSLMDIYPTFIQLAGGNLPSNIRIDGISIYNTVISGDESSRQVLFMYDSYYDTLVAVRYKQYKIYFWWQPVPSSNQYFANCNQGIPLYDYYIATLTHPRQLQMPILYNVDSDPSESNPLDLQNYTDVMDRVQTLLQLEKQTWLDRRERILDRKFLQKALVPCCNPPFCYCYSENSLTNLGVCVKQ